MPSLYERLNSVNPIQKKAPEPKTPSYLLIRETLADIAAPDAALFTEEIMNDLSKGSARRSFLPGDFLFFDTETTGLSRGAGTVAFLIGYGRFIKGKLMVTQVLMRDYPQEVLLLEDFLTRMSSCDCLISYNGLTFDLPLLQGRLIMNRLRSDLSEKTHLDLLHIARRVYKLRLGRVPLTRLEEAVLGLKRKDDLPGAMVPARYFEYLEKRDETLLDDVLEHNFQDIVSLARVFLTIAGLYQNPHLAASHQDLFSIGRAYETMGKKDRAISCYKACSDKTVRDLARFRMAEIYRKSKRDEEAVSNFEALQKDGAQSARVFIGLAKIYEHRYRNPRRALEIARQGMVYCFERFGEEAQQLPDFQDLERRSLRLSRKVEKER
ncbi:MAG: ribonuclease H-like domain-containing protein [Bacillota bacterium]|nr:ribonuclease H-like domain-containing protein [Bacillota bacterium]